MASLALQRLAEERKIFRKTRQYGFQAKPTVRKDGSTDLFEWACVVPGKKGSYMEEGNFPVTIRFTEDYPSKPPAVFLPPGFLHVNVFDNGGVW
ncbi:ubiquitin_conjugat_2 domain-containing protein [Haematococcus lacustris]|uniref:Ubiquitin_conjugat_2 domain-containing protein n=1 Tax=Haematococcus lacustris TaxID=44745 RepID=A0A699ZAI3_HAELA|nr:ubiquitin_conjugat_2 domain-containing protein [Haematococcus lacustris]